MTPTWHVLNVAGQSTEEGSFWGGDIQHAGEAGREPRGRRQPALEDLARVGVHQQIAGASGGLPAQACAASRLTSGSIRRGRGANERMLGFAECLVQLGGRAQTHQRPVGQLVADVVELAPASSTAST